MDAQYYHQQPLMGVRELDLSAFHHPNSLTHKINSVPVVKGSAAFFSFLRANLALNASSMSSCANTPQLEPALTTVSKSSNSHLYPAPHHQHHQSQQTRSPLASNPPLVPLDDEIPPLSLDPLETKEDKVEGLHLVADSVAQMHQRAFRAVVFNPLCLAGYAAVLATLYNLTPDLGTTLTVAAGVTMAYILGARYATRGYIRQAEQTNWWSWMRGGEPNEDIVLAARFGTTIIGALVLRMEPNPILAASLSSSSGRRKKNSLSLRKGGRGVIRAWTTRAKYRNQGIGQDLLMAAIRATKDRCGRDAEIGFAQEHANSGMVLPSMFNAAFRRDEVHATKALQHALSEWEGTKRKR